jgi:mono/diheme cytochrome c family protein
MKQMAVVVWRSTLVAVVSLFFASCAMRRSEPLTAKEFTPENSSVVNGERVYMLHCQKCHPGGEAGLGPAINSNPAPAFIKRFQVRHGLGVMPAFKKDEISKEALHDITTYLKAWKKY